MEFRKWQPRPASPQDSLRLSTLRLHKRRRTRTWGSPAPRGTRLRPQESFPMASALLSCPDGTPLPRSLPSQCPFRVPLSRIQTCSNNLVLISVWGSDNQPESNLTQAHRKKLRGSPWDILNRQHKPVLPPSQTVLYVPFPSPFLPKPSGLHTQGKGCSPSGPESSTRTAGGWPSRFTSCCINRGAWAHRP